VLAIAPPRGYRGNAYGSRVSVDEQLRAELLRWIEEDEETRERLAADGSLFVGYHADMEAVHRRNAERLEAVIAERGWPGRAIAGEDGASAAWRIVQHAIGEPQRVRAWLPLLREAVARGDAATRELAMLEDRIRVFEGRLQRYGTQYDWNATGDAMVPMNGVEEPETVDERRAAVGLPPIEWTHATPAGELRPVDLAERQREMDAWARRVGWRS